jgi:hypothetical protein
MLEIAIYVMGLFISITGFYIKRVYDKMDALEQDLINHKLEDAKIYATRNEISKVADDIKDLITPIAQKLASIEEFLRSGGKNTH